MNSLYNITNKFVELIEKGQEGELTEQEYNQLGEELSLELQNKSISIIGYIRNSESLIDAMKIEEKRIADMRKAGEKKLEKFKEYVKENMEKLGIEKIQTELGNLSLAKNPISVEIKNEEEIPAEYKTEVVTVKVDKKAIADNFKVTGEIPNGVIIHTENRSLRVK